MKNVVSAAEGAPFSAAVIHGRQVYVSGQLPVDAAGSMPESVAEQTRACMENVRNILEKAGCSMDDIVKTTVFMTDFSHFSEMNTEYVRFFSGMKPARSACQVSALARGAAVEIDCIAIKD